MLQTRLHRRELLVAGATGLMGLALGGQEIREATRMDLAPEWERWAIRRMWEERARMGVTPLLRLEPPFKSSASLYLKLESASSTGSLKHRVAWGLLMHALVNGAIGKQSRLFECSSGNTAIAEAYFARCLGLPFTAILRPGVSEGKARAIRRQGGEVVTAPEGMTPGAHLATLLPSVPHGYDINQFANAEKALDYYDAEPSRSMNLAAEVFRQLAQEGRPCPDWFVVGSGTGGTATSIARYLRKWADQGGRACPAKLAVVDPEGSVLFDWYQGGDITLRSTQATRIEGIGSGGPVRFGQNSSLLREGISRMFKVPDNASVAGMLFLSELLGSPVGASTGTNLLGAFRLLRELSKAGLPGTVITLVNDTGTRYQDTYFNPAWLATKGLKPEAWRANLERFWKSGDWQEPG